MAEVLKQLSGYAGDHCLAGDFVVLYVLRK